MAAGSRVERKNDMTVSVMQAFSLARLLDCSEAVRLGCSDARMLERLLPG
jgi:hypothetical protein